MLTAETVLTIIEDIVFIKVVHDRAVNDMFQDFTGDRDKGDRTVVFCFAFVSFLKDRYNPGFLPVIGNDALSERSLEKKSEGVG